jgi:catechol 2,3-dioxygenase-like lactoylglutathione lyase family enzyme
MSTILSSASVFLVRDVTHSAPFYRDMLGFRFSRYWGEPPNFCMVWRNESCIMLAKIDDNQEIRPNRLSKIKMWDAYFWVDDIQQLFLEYQQKGVVFSCSLIEKPYGVLEFALIDPDGYELAFGQELE